MSNTIRVLGISGSLRAKSCNTGLLRAAAGQLPAGMEMQFANLIDLPFSMPTLLKGRPLFRLFLNN